MILVVVGLYYVVGAAVARHVDDDPAFGADVVVPQGGSHTVAVLAALLEREVDRHGWVANDPAVFPSSLLTDMAAFQESIRASVEAVVKAFAIRTGTDPDLETALGALAVPGDRWAFDVGGSWSLQETSETYYREAVTALRRFNARMARGEVATLPDAALAATLVRQAGERLAAAATVGLAHVDARGGHWLDLTTAERLYATKGEVYAYWVVLQAVAVDVPSLGATDGWDAFEIAGQRAATFGPSWVMNGAAEGWLRATPLATQAAYLLDTRQALAPVIVALPAPEA